MIQKVNRLKDDQKEMRIAFLGGFAGQLVSGIIWLIASIVSVIISNQAGMLTLFFGCMGIFPLTQLTLKLMGRSANVSKENRLWQLGSQVAFTVPINFRLVGAIILFQPDWFFPAAMIIVGSHYLPFMTLYGMKMFGILAAILVIAGVTIGMYIPLFFSLGGWVTSGLLIVFAFVGKWQVQLEEKIKYQPNHTNV